MKKIPAWFAIGQILVAGFVVLSIFSIVLYAPFWMIGGLMPRAADAEAKASALVLEVKGDFCSKLKQILLKRGRTDDYIEIGMDSEWGYNPLHNDLEGYALAYGIASLLNNLFGKGKEPFWQQAYTNLPQTH